MPLLFPKMGLTIYEPVYVSAKYHQRKSLLNLNVFNVGVKRFYLKSSACENQKKR